MDEKPLGMIIVMVAPAALLGGVLSFVATGGLSVTIDAIAKQFETVSGPFPSTGLPVLISAVALVASVVAVVGLLDGLYQQRGESE